MKFNEELFALTVIMVAFFAVCGVLVHAKLTDDCPPGHVYIDHGETPQAGCWPEGVAQQMGVWPEP